MKTKCLARLILAVVLLLPACTTPSAPSRMLQQWSVIGSGRADWQRTETAVTGATSSGDSLLVSDKVYSEVAFTATASTANREASLAVRMQDAANGYLVVFVPDGIAWNNGVGGLWFTKRTAGAETSLGHYHGKAFPAFGQDANLSVVAAGSSFKVRLNGEEVLSVTDSTYATGHVGFRIYGDSGLPCSAKFTDVQVRE